MDGNYRIHIFLTQRTHKVIGTLLHLRIGTLHGIELNTTGITTGIHRGNRTATKTDAVVVTTHYDNLVALLRRTLQAVALGAIAHTTSQHDDLVVAILLIHFLAVDVLLLLVLEGQHRTRDERLTELITEVAGTVRCLNQYLFWSLIEPFAHRHQVFPRTSALLAIAWITGHIHSRSGDRPRTCTTTHTVADFATRTCSSTIEWLHGGWEVMCFCLQ